MERERTSSGDGRSSGDAALGDVARDVMDHAAVIVRDEIKIRMLETRRYAEHVRRDVAPRAALVAAAAALGTLAVIAGLVGLFLGIAGAIGSVAWTFVIYAALFAVVALVVAGLANQASRRDEGDEIARRFPAARLKETGGEHLLVAQRSSPEAHRREIEEARREALPP
jgi:hypothetical protein